MLVTAQGQIVEKYSIDRDQIAFVTDEQGNETFHYLYGLNVDQVLAQDSPTGMVWSLSDRLGSIDLLTDSAGNIVDKRTYDSFGNLLEQTNPLVAFRYGYTSREFDTESGLYFYRARYYDPGIGRFISVDPMSFEAGDTNLYRYVFNSPTQWTDPSGKILPLLLGMVVYGAIFGAVTTAAYGVASHIESGGRLDNIDWRDIGEKASIGALFGAVGGAFFGGLAVGALAAGVAPSTVIGTGLIFGAGTSGWQIGTGINNIRDGKPLTGAIDIISGIAGIAGLKKGYGQYTKAQASEAGLAAKAAKEAELITQGWTRSKNGDLVAPDPWDTPDPVVNSHPSSAPATSSGVVSANSTPKLLSGSPESYQFNGNQIDLLRSPIQIPSRASATSQVKSGYDQVKFRWADGTFKYEARWHTRTPNAPVEQGNTWVIMRTTPGSSRGGQKVEHIMTGENQWTSMSTWKAAVTARQNGVATQQQQQLLDSGHWLAD
jgi:RHS repeat-associated protein